MGYALADARTDIDLFLAVTAESLSKNGEGQGSSDVPTSANQQTALQNHLQPTAVSITHCNLIMNIVRNLIHIR